jgi:hypothetical protein
VVDVDRERTLATWWFADTVLERRPGERPAAAFASRRGTSRLEAIATV